MHDFLLKYLYHWTPERAIWLGGETLTWDARCAGIYTGFAVALLFFLIISRNQSRLPLLPVLVTAVVFIVPMFIDLLTINLHLRVANNSIRHLTGVFFGISFCSFLYPAVRQLFPVIIASAVITVPRILFLYLIGTLVSSLTLLDTLLSYYLLEISDWIGFFGLAFLILTGLYRAVLFPGTKMTA